MSDVQLTILDEIHARLGNITTSNGYRFDVEQNVIKRAKLTSFKNGDLPAINYFSGTDSLFTKTGGQETRHLSLTIGMRDMTMDEPFTDVATKMGNDVVTALYRSTDSPSIDDQPSLALGGIVEKIIVNDITPIIVEDSKPWCVALIDITIEYNINVGDFSTIFKY